MRFQITAHIFDEFNVELLKAVRFELDAASLFLAHDDALIRLRPQYPKKTISVTALPVSDYPQSSITSE